MAGRGRRAPRVAAPKPEGSTRMCVGCRGLFPRDSLVRLVRGPEGEIGVDRYLRAPGRGAHLCYSRACIEAAVKRRALSRAFPGQPGGTAPLPDTAALTAAIVAAIDARTSDALSLGRRRGQVASGAVALESAWSAGRLRLVLLAADAGENTAHRWEGRGKASGLPVHRYGDLASLGHTQGAEERVALGVVDPTLADRLALEFQRRDRVLVAA